MDTIEKSTSRSSARLKSFCLVAGIVGTLVCCLFLLNAHAALLREYKEWLRNYRLMDSVHKQDFLRSISIIHKLTFGVALFDCLVIVGIYKTGILRTSVLNVLLIISLVVLFLCQLSVFG